MPHSCLSHCDRIQVTVKLFIQPLSIWIYMNCCILPFYCFHILVFAAVTLYNDYIVARSRRILQTHDVFQFTKLRYGPLPNHTRHMKYHKIPVATCPLIRVIAFEIDIKLLSHWTVIAVVHDLSTAK